MRCARTLHFSLLINSSVTIGLSLLLLIIFSSTTNNFLITNNFQVAQWYFQLTYYLSIFDYERQVTQINVGKYQTKYRGLWKIIFNFFPRTVFLSDIGSLHTITTILILLDRSYHLKILYLLIIKIRFKEGSWEKNKFRNQHWKYAISVLTKVYQYSPERTCVGVFFNKFAGKFKFLRNLL